MNIQADIVIRDGDRSVLRQVVNVWIANERSTLLLRVRDQRLVRAAFDGWQGSLSRVAGLDRKAAAFSVILDKRCMAAAFTTMKRAVWLRQKDLARADQMNRARVITHVFKKWREASEKNHADSARASTARAFFVQRAALRAWKGELATRRQERFVREKQEALVRDAFNSELDHGSVAEYSLARCDGKNDRLERQRETISIVFRTGMFCFNLCSRRHSSLGSSPTGRRVVSSIKSGNYVRSMRVMPKSSVTHLSSGDAVWHE